MPETTAPSGLDHALAQERIDRRTDRLADRLAEKPQSLPTARGIPMRQANFATLAAALDYAADAATGLCFHDGKGHLQTALSYASLRAGALTMAQRLLGLGLNRGDRIALIAETDPDFVITFFACQYAGLVPVPLPVTVHLGGRDAFVAVLERLVAHSRARICLGSEQYGAFIAAAQLPGVMLATTYNALATRDPTSAVPVPTGPEEVAYVQFTSGSTRLPRGAVITANGVMRNIEAMLCHGVELSAEDRFCSWLPLYHDMGLVGMLMAPLAGQATVDYLDSRVFAMRPRLWPAIMSRNGGTLTYSPPFGYELCARRMREGEAAQYQLAQWRVAGVGAEMIRADVLRRFAATFAGSGFDARAFLPCYGMAEVGLGISFSSLGIDLRTDVVDRDRCGDQGEAEPPTPDSHPREFVCCGEPLPGYDVEIRDQHGQVLPERRVGELFVRGPSVMQGYLDEPEATLAVLRNGWLDTGDLAYRIGRELVLTGRQKDLIIINGRNIWPQDLELIAESQGVRTGSAAAFAVHAPTAAESGEQGSEQVVMVIEYRTADAANEQTLLKGIRSEVRAEFGVDCTIVATDARTLPRTSSGKLSRVRARQMYENGELNAPSAATDPATDATDAADG